VIRALTAHSEYERSPLMSDRKQTRAMKSVLLSLFFLLATTPSKPSQMVVSKASSRVALQGAVENFTGSVRVDRLFTGNPPSRTGGAYVSFEPGARSAWHSHPLGQTLVVTAGVGRVQQWGAEAQELRVGDVVWTPPGVRHWHGAAPQTAMTHLAIAESLDGKAVEWMEQVSNAQYTAALPGKAKPDGTEPSIAQKSFGDIAPKLAQLTDDVLFGDVWERPQLSKRDRSLVTTAALVATGKTEQMTSHFTRALDNGVTREELTEMITHLAFYAGWPSAVSAAAKAREVFDKKR
jgi:4-carboxymuconolactone decarboxylase